MADPPAGHALTDNAADPIRERLLDAAARVFASRGYSGTKIMDIVKEAGLSTGAVYGRFNSKDELLVEAVLRWVQEIFPRERDADLPVADFAVRVSGHPDAALTDAEAMQLEAFVAARREPQVADALAAARARWRGAPLQPLLQAAMAEGTVAPDIDVESLLYFVEAMHLGLLMQRAAHMPAPDREAWDRFIASMLGRVFAGPPAGATRDAETQ